MGVSPTFLVIGAMKSGTTTLFELLRDHPEIGMCREKEPAFFCHDEIYARGWSWYESLFEGAEGMSAIGEASTSYTKRFQFPNAAPRIAQHLPDARIIYIVRHPLERIESQWMHGLHTGWHDRNFERALADLTLIDPSRYWRQISAYRDHFPDDRVLVVFFDELKANPKHLLKRCFRFLDVDPTIMPPRLDLAANVSTAIESDRRSLKALRRLPSFNRAVSLFPLSWRDEIRRLFFTKRVRSRPRWSGVGFRRTIDELLDDTRTFLEFYGKSLDYWNLDPEMDVVDQEQIQWASQVS